MNATRIRTELAGLLQDLGKKDRSPVDLMYLGFWFGCGWYAGLHAGRETAVSDAAKNPEFESKIRRNENGEFDTKAATGNDVHGQIITTVSGETGKAIRAYSTLGSDFQRIQVCARNGNGDAETMQQVALIDRAIHSQRLTRDSNVFRGVDHAETLARLKEGHTIRMNGFVSTSTDEETARRFAGANGALLKVRLPAGTPAFSVSGSCDVNGRRLDYAAESEVLLERGAVFEVVKVEERKPGKPRVVHLEYVPEGKRGK